MEDRFGHRISYLRVSITDRCNERCIYCMPQETQEWLPRAEVLSYEEITRLVRVATTLGVTKLRVTGGEPLARANVLELFRLLRDEAPAIRDLGVSTNGSLLAREVKWEGETVTMAAALRRLGVRSLNVSLDSLDPVAYRSITGRGFLPDVLAGLAAARAVEFPSIKLNCVLMRGRNETQLPALVQFAGEHGHLIRFIELMPVSTTEVLSDENFLPVAEARRIIERSTGSLTARPDFRTNGPASYYQLLGSDQLVGFIGALTNLHFCENCNKLRLTCDGKLRPCLGSHLEFDIRGPLRAGAEDEGLRSLFRMVVDRKPLQHDFRDSYQPKRKMVAIGG